uniref:Uncharacterized protein n=1 Tax=Anguilla anguilla TaxID=7936 RepID=A0A0E9Q2Z8_ANGAN
MLICIHNMMPSISLISGYTLIHYIANILLTY